MKPIFWSTCLLLAALPSLAAAEGRRVHPLPADGDTQVSVLPVAVDTGDSRSVLTLRETLRQPFEDASEDRPFRLSDQERQRMRDQLRSQSVVRADKR